MIFINNCTTWNSCCYLSLLFMFVINQRSTQARDVFLYWSVIINCCLFLWIIDQCFARACSIFVYLINFVLVSPVVCHQSTFYTSARLVLNCGVIINCCLFSWIIDQCFAQLCSIFDYLINFVLVSPAVWYYFLFYHTVSNVWSCEPFISDVPSISVKESLFNPTLSHLEPLSNNF